MRLIALLTGVLRNMRLLILAAGQGKRIGSEAAGLPKVMRRALDRPLIDYVLSATGFVEEKDVYVIVGFCKEAVMEAYPELNYVVQEERKGTGHAVMCAADAFRDYDGDVMVINGDMPLFKRSSLEAMCRAHRESGAACTLGTCIAKGEIPPYGRIIRDEVGNVSAIVEQKDATEEQRQIRELNVGVYIFDARSLFAVLPKLKKSPVSGEYYITDVPEYLARDGKATRPFVLEDEREAMGVNTAEDLAAVEDTLRKYGI